MGKYEVTFAEWVACVTAGGLPWDHWGLGRSFFDTRKVRPEQARSLGRELRAASRWRVRKLVVRLQASPRLDRGPCLRLGEQRRMLQVVGPALSF
jgi:formylglycine-generating enzyme required for sulfatase activity